jgi:ribonuclease HI
MIEAWFDGVCEPRNPGGHAAFGALVKVDGAVVLSVGKYVGHGPTMSNNVAEYSGAIAVLEEIPKHRGVAKIYGDSKLVVMQLTRQWAVHGGFYVPFYERARKLYEPLRVRASFFWISRDKNGECDRLSKDVLHSMGIKFRIQPEASAVIQEYGDSLRGE